MNIGDEVGDFTLPDATGTPRSLDELLAAGPVVLFFYPAAFSAGCTAEACHFRDVTPDFQAVGAQPVGISGDPVEKLSRFAEAYKLGYPLLSDEAGAVRGQFGVEKSIISPTRRTTIVIGTDHRVIEVVRSEIRMNVHADRALAALRAGR